MPEELRPKRCLPLSVYLEPLWWLGLILVVISLVINSISLSYGSVMLLSSLSVATIVISTFINPCFFNEKLSCYKDVFCSMILCLGCVICILQSPVTKDYDKEGIAQYMNDIMLSKKNITFLLVITVGHIVFAKCKDKLLDDL